MAMKREYVCAECGADAILVYGRSDGRGGQRHTLLCEECGAEFEDADELETRPATLHGRIKEFVDDTSLRTTTE